MKKNLIVKSYGNSDIGQFRTENEDFFEISDKLFIVADGMGGHNAGEIASKMAVNTIIKYFNKYYQSKSKDEKETINVKLMIKRIIKKTNEKVYLESTNNLNLKGMGTTLVLAFIEKPDILHIENVGDSRGYLYRNRKLKILTEDHSVTSSLLRNGLITKKESLNHPYRSHLTRSIGTKPTIEAFYNSFKAQNKDIILLCSDGLWNTLSENDINFYLQTNDSPKFICDKLLEKSKESGSKDNITVIVIKVL